MEETFIDTAEGVFTACFSECGLARLEFPSSKPGSEARPVPKDTGAGTSQWRTLTRKALNQVLRGEAPASMPPLDLSEGTEFQRVVWNALAAIPPGRTQTYAEVAKVIGRPKAVRAVGQACGANPIPVLIPCHRVLAARDGLGGFSGGLNWKLKLLQREGVLLKAVSVPTS